MSPGERPAHLGRSGGGVRVFLSAGDPSGDVHGALLVSAIRCHLPDAWFYGICGRQMTRAGVAQVADSTRFSGIGIAASVPKIPGLVALYSGLKGLLRATPPALVILIDFPAFNMRVLSFAKRIGLPTLYWFPPAAWKRAPSKAARRVAALATRVATPFEWSARIFRELGGRAEWVGHPVLERYANRPSEARARGLLAIPLPATPVAVLPGNRPQEIRYILPLLLRACREAEKAVPGIFPVISCGPSADRAELRETAERFWPGALITEDTVTLLSACRAALTKSGTVTLDAAACGLPMVATYAGSWMDWLQYRLLVKGHFKYIAAPNILLDRMVVPECYEKTGTPAALGAELVRLLADGPAREECKAGLAEACALLGEPGSAERTASIVAEMLGGPAGPGA